MNHIMLDLETLDTTPTAVVLSIGAIAFNDAIGELGDKFYIEMTDDISTQQKKGRTISGSTVQWWVQQNAEARNLFFPNTFSSAADRTLTEVALREFAEFVGANGGEYANIWGNGADFDNVILGTLYTAFDMKKPWRFGKDRCYRTMKNLGYGPEKATRRGTHHNALDDAITQAVHLQEIFSAMRNP